jgi:hypothetical protein
VTRGESKWAFVTCLGFIFSFHSWQANREKKKTVPSPQPKGIKTFLSKSVVIFVIVILKMTTLFERNEDRVTGFLK